MRKISPGVFVVVALAIAAAAAAAFYFSGAGKAQYATAVVERRDITQEASASGNVEAPTTVDLQFQASGRLVSLRVQTGDAVSAGDVLARQDSSVLSAQLQQAQAAVAAQEAQMQLLQQGTRPEQVAVTQAQVASDQSALAQANQGVVNAIQAAYTQSDDAVHNKVDQFFGNPQSASPQLSFTSSDSQMANTVVSDRVSIEPLLSNWHKDIGPLAASGDLASAIANTQANLASVTHLLSDANSALNNAAPLQGGTQATISGWIASVATARANINSAVSALSAAVAAQQSASSALAKDQKNLALEQAGSTPQAIATQEALVAQAQANAAAIAAQLSQLRLVSPVDGTVTAVNGSVGETLSPNSVLISILPAAKLQVGVNLSEDNVAKVAVGQQVSISLDAFPGSIWQGAVTKIDPAQTVIGGAVYYKTTVVFAQQDSRIKSGMTANVLIQTGAASSTLVVPASAVQASGAGAHVQLYQDGSVSDRPVALGLKGQDGMIEITSGLSEGEVVVTGKK